MIVFNNQAVVEASYTTSADECRARRWIALKTKGLQIKNTVVTGGTVNDNLRKSSQARGDVLLPVLSVICHMGTTIYKER